MKLDDYHKIEIDEIFNRSRALDTLRVQIFAFTGTASIALMGTAVGNQKVFLFFVSSILCLFLSFVDSIIRTALYVIYSRALILEKLYSPDKEAAFIITLVSRLSGQQNYSEIISQIHEANSTEQLIQIIKSCRSSKIGLWLPFAVFFGEILIGLFLYYFADWPLL